MGAIVVGNMEFETKVVSDALGILGACLLRSCDCVILWRLNEVCLHPQKTLFARLQGADFPLGHRIPYGSLVPWKWVLTYGII